MPCKNSDNKSLGDATEKSESAGGTENKEAADFCASQCHSDWPIGIFDSGVGGLTVAKEIINLLPNEKIVYVGDNEFFPYGKKTHGQLEERVLKICQWLIDYGCKAIVIACNTATAAGLTAAQEKFGSVIDIIGVIEAGVITALHTSKNSHIGVLATEATVQSKAYAEIFSQHADMLGKDSKIAEIATPLLVDFVENTMTKFSCGDESEAKCREFGHQIITEYLSRLKSYDVDTIVLGCTHFPIIEDMISEDADNIEVISPSHETALQLKEILDEKNLLSDNGIDLLHTFFISGYNSNTEQKFENIISLLFDDLPYVIEEASFN